MSSKKFKTKKVRFHVSLPNHSEEEKYWIKAARKNRKLFLHTDKTRLKARKKDPSMSEEKAALLSHFTKKKVKMPKHKATRVQVRKTRRSEGFEDGRSAVTLAAMYNPRPKKNRRTDSPILVPPPPTGDDPVIDYESTAKLIVFHHPDLFTDDTSLTETIYSYMDQFQSAAIYQIIYDASVKMSELGEPTAGEDGWAKLEEPPYKPDGSTEVMTMTRDVIQQELIPAMNMMMIHTKNDPDLQGSTDPNNPQDGTYVIEEGTSVQEAGVDNWTEEEGITLVASGSGDDWSAKIKNSSSVHGLETSIKVVGERQIQINFKNTYLRYLGAYISFYDARNAFPPYMDTNDNVKSKPSPMTVSNWSPDDMGKTDDIARDAMKGALGSSNIEYPDLRYLGKISPIDVIFGVPNYALPGQLTVQVTFPEGAVKAEVFGFGLGSGANPYPNACIIGGVLTGVINIGLPTLMLAVGAAAQSNKEVYDIVNSPGVQTALTLASIGMVSESIGAAAYDQKMDWSILSSIGTSIFSAGAEALLEYYEREATEAMVEDEIPFVGWIILALNIATTLAEMAETISEVASSPWGIQNSISTSITSTITIHPDPRAAGAMPQGPNASFVTKIIYKDNSPTQVIKQDTIDTVQLLTTVFDNPLGGELKFEVDYYVGSWLAAKATTSFMPNDEATTSNITMYLVEYPVPLKAETVFTHNSILSYQNNAYSWFKTPNAPTETLSNAHLNATGNYISEWLGLTFSQRYGMIGFGWKAAGTGLSTSSGTSNIQLNVFQNIDIPGVPMDYVKYPDHGFTKETQLIYDNFPPKFKMTNGNWDLDDNNKPIAADDDNPLGEYFVDPTKAANDPSIDGGYHLRKVDLTSSSNFDTSEGQLSHGRFPYFPNSFGFHPSGHVIAVNTEYSKIMILELDQAGVADNSLPLARIYSGQALDLKSSNGREGLLFAPIAVGCSYDGTILILDHISNETTAISRVQAFDLNGNPVNRFLDENGNPSAFLPLTNSLSQPITYMDLSVVGDNKMTYLFVLYHDSAGNSPENYKVDIYKCGENIADQSYILTIDTIPAAKLTVDMWHTLYTLNFALVKDAQNQIAGPPNGDSNTGGRTVPSISQWIPSNP